MECPSKRWDGVVSSRVGAWARAWGHKALELPYCSKWRLCLETEDGTFIIYNFNCHSSPLTKSESCQEGDPLPC